MVDMAADLRDIKKTLKKLLETAEDIERQMPEK
jgi:hypothetical protein